MQTELEQILISAGKVEMIVFFNSHPEYFEEAVQLSLSDKHPYNWRAAGLIFSCMKENDKRLKKHIDKIIGAISDKKDGHKRELLNILNKMKLNDENEGLVFDISMALWEAIDKIPSLRYTAFKFIVKTAKKYPELSNEVAFLTQNHFLNTLSPGIKIVVERIAQEFKHEEI